MATKSVDDKYNQMMSYCKSSNAFICFDLETNGRGNPMNHPYLKIIEIGAVKIVNDEVVDTFQTFIKPYSKIPKTITEITGITDDMVQDAPDFSKALREFKDFIGNLPIIAHNAAFDSSFIYYFGDMIGIDFHINPLIDSLKLSRKCFPKEKNSLDVLAERCGVLQINHHRADDDAYVLGEIFIYLKNNLLQEDIKNAKYIDLTSIKSDIPDYKNCKYQICSANYWEKGNFKRIYVTIKTDKNDYVDFFYDLTNHYWSFKNKEQSKMKINFAALNHYFREYVQTQKPVLKQYIDNM